MATVAKENPQGGTTAPVVRELMTRFGQEQITPQSVTDTIPTVWASADKIVDVLDYLKNGASPPYDMLYDLTAVDERLRQHKYKQPDGDFTVVYHLLSTERNSDTRIKVALPESNPKLPSITRLWASANWYECEAWDMFGVRFDTHPHLRRILMPPTWEGHPLRKEHPARATELERIPLTDEQTDIEQQALRFHPEQWGMQFSGEDSDYMFLNLGPNHPSVHGVFRIVLQLDGELIVDAVPDIGYHHRGAEKMGERQTWHTFIPYTDRIDYLGGVMNNLPYVLAVEQLAGIKVPQRVEVIRVMLCELFRIASHLVFLGTYAQDVGQLSPVFFTFNDRERIFHVIEAICGGRMHPSWFRIGGLAQDLPKGWDRLVSDFAKHMPSRFTEFEKLILKNRIIKKRTIGVGRYSTREAIEWGITGPGLRASGLEWDYRKKRPYSGYQHFKFDIPIGKNGDSYDRCVVRLEEMRQSLRIIEQCINNMPDGSYKADHPLTVPPRKEHTMHDIETLINHFLSVTWGPVIPPGEASAAVEATKGVNSYYLISDGGTTSYRTRIRTPSFPHLQMIPFICRGLMVPDLIAILGSIDFVMADVDR